MSSALVNSCLFCPLKVPAWTAQRRLRDGQHSGRPWSGWVVQRGEHRHPTTSRGSLHHQESAFPFQHGAVPSVRVRRQHLHQHSRWDTCKAQRIICLVTDAAHHPVTSLLTALLFLSRCSGVCLQCCSCSWRVCSLVSGYPLYHHGGLSDHHLRCVETAAEQDQACLQGNVFCTLKKILLKASSFNAV